MNVQDHWKNRRRMAWASTIASLLFPLLILFTESAQLGAIAAPFYVFTGAVVGAYIGFATMDDKDSRKNNTVDSPPRGNN